MDTPVVDRAVFERLLGIGRRRGIDLMRKFGSYQTGIAILIFCRRSSEKGKERQPRRPNMRT
jgi:hypothetical protein